MPDVVADAFQLGGGVPSAHMVHGEKPDRKIQQMICERALSPKLLKLSLPFSDVKPFQLWRNSMCRDIGFVFKGDCIRTDWIVLGFAVEIRSKNLALTLEQTRYAREDAPELASPHKEVKAKCSIMFLRCK